jgi:hypothetical protein
MDRTQEYGTAFALAVVHVGLLSAGFLILADQFSFPEILRAPSEERLALFRQNQSLIVPAYYMMGLSGLTQVMLAVMFHQSFAKAGSTLLVAALVAGVLGGAFQMMGFMRWPIAVPYLAEQMGVRKAPRCAASSRCSKDCSIAMPGWSWASIWASWGKVRGRC